MSRRIDRTARADRIIDAALELYLERPRDEVTFELLAERAGLKFWQVYNFHGNLKTLFRAAVARLVQQVEDGFAAMPKDAPSVSEAARAYAHFVAAAMQRQAYSQFLYLLIRDRCVEPFLDEAYEQRIARVMRDGLERIIGNAGQRYEMVILLSPAASRDFVKALEVELVLPQLLPNHVPPAREAVDAIVQRIADRVIAASYALGSRAA